MIQKINNYKNIKPWSLWKKSLLWQYQYFYLHWYLFLASRRQNVLPIHKMKLR